VASESLVVVWSQCTGIDSCQSKQYAACDFVQERSARKKTNSGKHLAKADRHMGLSINY